MFISLNEDGLSFFETKTSFAPLYRLEISQFKEVFTETGIPIKKSNQKNRHSEDLVNVAVKTHHAKEETILMR